MKKDIHECSGCGRNKTLCQCAGSGAAADDEKSKKDNDNATDNKCDVSATSNSVNNVPVFDSQKSTNEDKQHITLLDKKNQLIHCVLFASTANKAAPVPYSHFQEENGADSAKTSVGVGIKMSGMDE